MRSLFVNSRKGVFSKKIRQVVFVFIYAHRFTVLALRAPRIPRGAVTGAGAGGRGGGGGAIKAGVTAGVTARPLAGPQRRPHLLPIFCLRRRWLKRTAGLRRSAWTAYART
jgi:hypothetical protein